MQEKACSSLQRMAEKSLVMNVALKAATQSALPLYGCTFDL
jgi:hypothetical protein